MKYHHGDLKQALLDRAEEVIEEYGLDAVKLSCLARDLGVSHSAPSRHFKDRNELLAALGMNALEALKEDILNDPSFHSPNPMIRLNGLLKLQLRAAISRPAQFFILGLPDLSLLTGPSFADAMARYTGMLRECIRNCQREGWRSGENEDHLLLLVSSLAVGLETNIRFATKAQGPMTNVDIVRITQNLENAMSTIDLFVPCPAEETTSQLKE
jgi:AcrR family transcriptional regulator